MKFTVKTLLLVVATLTLVPSTSIRAASPSAPIVVPEFNPRTHVLSHLGIFLALNAAQIAYNGMPHLRQGVGGQAQPAITKGPKKKLTLKQHLALAATTSKAFARALSTWKNYQAYGSELKAVVWPAATKSLKKRTPAQWTHDFASRLRTFAAAHKLVCAGIAAQLALGSAYAWHCNSAHNKGVVAETKRLADETKAQEAQENAAQTERDREAKARRFEEETAERTRLAQEEADRLAREAAAKAERDRLAREAAAAAAEADVKRNAQIRIAAQVRHKQAKKRADAAQAEALRAQQAEALRAQQADRLAREEADRLAREEADRLAREAAKAKRQHDQAQRIAAAQTEHKRLEAEAAARRLKEEAEKAERNRLAREEQAALEQRNREETYVAQRIQLDQTKKLLLASATRSETLKKLQIVVWTPPPEAATANPAAVETAVETAGAGQGTPVIPLAAAAATAGQGAAEDNDSGEDKESDTDTPAATLHATPLIPFAAPLDPAVVTAVPVTPFPTPAASSLERFSRTSSDSAATPDFTAKPAQVRIFPLDVYAKTDPSFFQDGDAFFKQTAADDKGNNTYAWFTYSTATQGYNESHLTLSTRKPSGVLKGWKQGKKLESYTTAAEAHPKKGALNLWGLWR